MLRARQSETKIGAGRALRYVWLGVLLCVAVGILCFFLGRTLARNSDEKRELSAVVLENRLSAISELASVTYSYTNMAQFSSSSDFYGMTVPFTTKSFILTYDGIIKAGVDLHQADVTTAGRTVTVHLPQAQILSHEIAQNSVEIFDEKTSIFNPFTVEDFTAFQADQEVEMEKKAVGKGLLTEAQTKAEDSVRLLLESALPEDYTLTVKSSSTKASGT